MQFNALLNKFISASILICSIYSIDSTAMDKMPEMMEAMEPSSVRLFLLESSRQDRRPAVLLPTTEPHTTFPFPLQTTEPKAPCKFLKPIHDGQKPIKLYSDDEKRAWIKNNIGNEFNQNNDVFECRLPWCKEVVTRSCVRTKHYRAHLKDCKLSHICKEPFCIYGTDDKDEFRKHERKFHAKNQKRVQSDDDLSIDDESEETISTSCNKYFFLPPPPAITASAERSEYSDDRAEKRPVYSKDQQKVCIRASERQEFTRVYLADYSQVYICSMPWCNAEIRRSSDRTKHYRLHIRDCGFDFFCGEPGCLFATDDELEFVDHGSNVHGKAIANKRKPRLLEQEHAYEQSATKRKAPAYEQEPTPAKRRKLSDNDQSECLQDAMLIDWANHFFY